MFASRFMRLIMQGHTAMAMRLGSLGLQVGPEAIEYRTYFGFFGAQGVLRLCRCSSSKSPADGIQRCHAEVVPVKLFRSFTAV